MENIVKLIYLGLLIMLPYVWLIYLIIKISLNQETQKREKFYFCIPKKVLENDVYLSALILMIVLIIVLVSGLIIKIPADFLGGILVEMTGMLLDAIIIFFLFNLLKFKGEENRDIKRLKEELADYRSWKETEASFRVLGIIRRLNKYNENKFDLNDYYISEIKISDVKIRHSKITETSITKSEINHTDFTTSIIETVDFHKTDLEFAIFNKCTVYNVTTLQGYFYKKFPSGFQVDYLKFTSEIERDELPIGDWYDSDFDNSDIQCSIFDNISLVRCSFEYAKISDCIFYLCKMQNCDFPNAILNGIIFDNVTFFQCDFRDVDLTHCAFKKVEFHQCAVNPALIPKINKEEIIIKNNNVSISLPDTFPPYQYQSYKKFSK
ncbi:MAG: pentapeptide repeat-containing protein [Chitinophagales bacterium]